MSNCCIEEGKCEICGKDAQIERTYFHYPIKCECHAPNHFELVRHCSECIPSVPNRICLQLRDMDGKAYQATLSILPSTIEGAYTPLLRDRNMGEDGQAGFRVKTLRQKHEPAILRSVDTTGLRRSIAMDEWLELMLRTKAQPPITGKITDRKIRYRGIRFVVVNTPSSVRYALYQRDNLLGVLNLNITNSYEIKIDETNGENGDDL